MNEIGQRLLGGVMFHSELADLFLLLGLKGFYKWQKCQMFEEMEHLQKIKCYVMKYHYKLLDLQSAEPPEHLISNDWYTRSSLDVTQTDIVNILKAAFDKYVKWEEETKSILYNKLAQIQEITDKKKIEKLIENVECELAKVKALRQSIQVTNFSPIYIQTLQKEFE